MTTHVVDEGQQQTRRGAFKKCSSFKGQSLRSLSATLSTSSVRSLEELKASIEKLENEKQDASSDSTIQSDSSSSVGDNESSLHPTTFYPAPTGATNDQVRSKLLNRLGIQPTSAAKNQAGNSPMRKQYSPRKEAVYDLPLKDHSEKKTKDTSSQTPSFLRFLTPKSSVVSEDSAASTLEQQTTIERHVHFHPTVTAHAIPSHKAYSKRIKQTIWSNAAELEENVARNVYEFAAENWDWEQVIDDEDMIWYNGQKIHPVHFERQEEENENRRNAG